MRTSRLPLLCLCTWLAACGGDETSTGGTSASTSVCGDATVEADEACDDGNTATETCAYGEASCTICDTFCRLVPGTTSSCGDGVADGARGETCDDGNTTTEACAYGETHCTVCDEACHDAAGAVSYCGDGALDEGEACDDGNTAIDACTYGEASCSVCGPACDDVPGLPLFCGDGVLDPAAGEVCDDGNTVEDDGCDTTCRPTGCGNGVVTGGELCDDGNHASGDGCDVTCKPTGCGSGVATAGELCDDDNLVDGDGCDSNCTWTACGNGVTAGGEQCDDANPVEGDGCDTTCKTTGCGSGVVTGAEQCDDGNVGSGDGCDANCTFTGCGNGVVVAGESCDDGNAITEACLPGQTSCSVCNAICQLVAGETFYCGDFVTNLAQGEACDDGNTVDGDGCESDCQLACGQGSGADAAILTSTGCYLYFETQVNWPSASAQCAALGFSLVTITSLYENNQVTSLASNSSTWLGLNDLATEGVFVWESGTPVTYLQWQDSEPNDSNGEDCTELTASGPWNDLDCDGDLRAVICELSTCGDGVLDANEGCDDANLVDDDGCDSTCKPTGCGSGVITGAELCDDGNLTAGDGCEADCTLVCGPAGSGASAAHDFGGHCYLVFSAPTAWSAASLACAAQTGYLVSIEDAVENAFVAGIVASTSHIGYTDAASENTFVWESGNPTGSTHWRPGEPNGLTEDCVEIHPIDGGWNDITCAGVNAYVCELPGG